MAEKQELGLADEVLEGHQTDGRGAAVIGIVAVISHHEVMASRNDKFRCVIKYLLIADLLNEVYFTLWQRFLI